MFKSQPHPYLSQTVSRKILKTDGSNHAFRKLLYDFFTVSSRLEEIRSHIGHRVQVTGPQFTIMLAIAELQGEKGVSVGRVADYLHVTGTFVAIESGKLAKRKFLVKKSSMIDRRVTLLMLTDKSVRVLQTVAPELQKINDTFFDLSSRTEFLLLCKILDRLVDNSQRTVDLIYTHRPKTRLGVEGI